MNKALKEDPEEFAKRHIIGLTEYVTIFGRDGAKEEVIARIDTGATNSSIDVKLAAQLQLGPITKTKVIKSASGSTLRAVVEAKVILAGEEIISEFTLANRSHMKYRLLVGQNLLDKKFIIDPARD